MPEIMIGFVEEFEEEEKILIKVKPYAAVVGPEGIGSGGTLKLEFGVETADGRKLAMFEVGHDGYHTEFSYPEIWEIFPKWQKI